MFADLSRLLGNFAGFIVESDRALGPSGARTVYFVGRTHHEGVLLSATAKKVKAGARLY